LQEARVFICRTRHGCKISGFKIVRFEGHSKTEDIEEFHRIIYFSNNQKRREEVTRQGYLIMLLRILCLMSMLIYPKQKANFCFLNPQILANRLFEIDHDMSNEYIIFKVGRPF